MESKNIKDYLHLYLGCEVAGYKDQVTRSKIVGFYSDTIILSPHEYATPAGTFTRPEMRVNINAVKPILRPLSDMTEEEILIWKAINNATQSPNIHQMANEFVWMLSKGFDLFGLLDAGVAIKKSQ